MKESPAIRLRVHLRADPEQVFERVATDAGRATFWARSTCEQDGVVTFRFRNGTQHVGRVLRSEPPRRFSVTYFGNSVATFDIEPDGVGGTDLTLTETRIPPPDWAEQRAGWVSVLLTLKAAVDFSVDLRNEDPRRRWEDGYVDV